MKSRLSIILQFARTLHYPIIIKEKLLTLATCGLSKFTNKYLINCAKKKIKNRIYNLITKKRDKQIRDLLLNNEVFK